ncbi:hypothetical protein TNCV_3018511 [Trichonephila clavipes]|nr:hypothetical protein TNCV_3018511 [Trichonephila clavipes]
MRLQTLWPKLMLVIVNVMSFPKGRNECCQSLRLVGLLYDRWRHHVSPPPQFRHGAGKEGNILQPLHLCFVLQPPIDLTSTYSVCTPREVLQCKKKGGNHLEPDTDYMMEQLNLPNQAPRGSGESLQKFVARRCPKGTQHLFCWPIRAISGSNSRIFSSRELN